jgi:flagellar biosynthesis regulator FlbT
MSKKSDELIKRYSKLVDDLIKEFANELKKRNVDIPKIKRHLLETAYKQLYSLKKQRYNIIKELLGETFAEAHAEEIKLAQPYFDIKALPISTQQNLIAMDCRSLNKMLKVAENNYYNALKACFREENFSQKLHAFRETRTQAEKLLAGDTYYDKSIKDLTTQLANNTMCHIQTADGKRMFNMSINAYAKMAINTAVQRTNNHASIETMNEVGHNWVRFSSHGWTCEDCARYAEGRAYSLVRGDKYPYLYDLRGFRDGYLTLHPNCRHRIHGFFEESRTPEELKKIQAISGNFEDIRTEKNKLKYMQSQLKYKRKK